MFSNNAGEDVVLIVDVQSSVVRSTLVLFSADAMPVTLYTYDRPVTFKPDADNQYLIKTTVMAVGENVTQAMRYLSLYCAHRRIPCRIGTVHYVLSSPWIVSEAKTVSIKFAKNTRVTKSTIVAMVAN